MKNFKEMLDKDLDSTFYNTGEFAITKKVKYDNVIREIPIIYDTEEMKARKTTISGDNAEGIVGNYVTIRVRLSDLGKVPRQDARFWLENELYKVKSVLDEYNELIIDLERFDE